MGDERTAGPLSPLPASDASSASSCQLLSSCCQLFSSYQLLPASDGPCASFCQVLSAFCQLTETVSHILSSIDVKGRRSLELTLLDDTKGTIKAVEPRASKLTPTAHDGKLSASLKPTDTRTDNGSSMETASLETGSLDALTWSEVAHLV